jgi:hypothetical protein
VGDEEEQASETRALIGLLGRVSGLSELPAIGDVEPTPLPDANEAVKQLSAAQHVPGPVRLEVLARMVRAQTHDNLTVADPTPLAASLMPVDASAALRNETTQQLIDRLKDSTAGADPLGRTIGGITMPDALINGLSEDVKTTILTVLPQCGAVTTDMNGVQALNIVTDTQTATPLDGFEPIVDPLLWPKCAIEAPFFTNMSVIAPPGQDPTPTPDNGWRATLREICDFSFGIGPPQLTTTDLDFVFFFNHSVPAAAVAAPAPATLGCAGCTYDFNASPDGKISVDQGFLLVEDLGAVRRYRTQKLVHFTAGDPPSNEVCIFWSVASGLIQQGCSTAQ